MSTPKFQPLFVAYAKAHGREPQAQIDFDRTEYPGGCMCGFILWIGEKKRAFKEASPRSFLGDTITDLKAWQRFVVHG